MRIASRHSPAGRINVRLLVFGAVVLSLIGYPVYLFVDHKVHGGIWVRDKYTEADLKTISGFEWDPSTATDAQIPAKFRELDGKRVMLKGEMVLRESADNRIDKFDLVYSIQKCCFEGPPKIQHFIKCRMKPGMSARYYTSKVKVVGTLHVGVEREAGYIVSVYRMDAESVEQD